MVAGKIAHAVIHSLKIMIKDNDPLYQAAIKAIRKVYQQAVKSKNCRDCGYVIQRKECFCSHPDSDFFELGSNLASPAQNCVFFERRDYD